MMNKWWILSALLLCSCASNFGDSQNASFRHAKESDFEKIIIRGKTTMAEIDERFGRPIPHFQGEENNTYCYQYYESRMPFYNFLPTNFFYMRSDRHTWQLCVDYDEHKIVQDFRFNHSVEKKVDSPMAYTIEEITCDVTGKNIDILPSDSSNRCNKRKD